MSRDYIADMTALDAVRDRRESDPRPPEQPTAPGQTVVQAEAIEPATRAEIVAWIEAQQAACSRHTDLEAGINAACCICYWNAGLVHAAQLARGDYGPTSARVAERLRRGDT